MKFLSSCVFVVLLLLTIHTATLTQTKVRVGVFDSRGIAIAYAQSAAFQQQMREFRAQGEKEKASNDTKLLSELEAKAQAQQALLHLQAFSIGSVSEILANYQADVAAVAKQANVAAIVSQFELAYHDPSVETVDVTEALVKKINNSPQMPAMLAGLKTNKPLSMLEALGIKD
jgi:hypothetical protein